MLTLLQYCIIFALGIIMLFLSGSVASAHAEPERAEPEINGSVEFAPATLEIWFSEEVSDGTEIHVIGPDGERADKGETEIDLFDPDRRHVIVALKDGLPAGTYKVDWTSVSGEDEDLAQGSFTFDVHNDSTQATPISASPVAAATVESTPVTLSGISTGTVSAEQFEYTVDTRAFSIAIGAGALAVVFIAGFSFFVRHKTQRDTVIG